jgi:hypothetical protein
MFVRDQDGAGPGLIRSAAESAGIFLAADRERPDRAAAANHTHNRFRM